MADRRERNHKWYSEFREATMEFVIEDGEGGEVVIPACWEVCGTCDGEGKHVNPSIDSHGLTSEDFDQDPDFAEDYWAGRYDVPCNECGGRRVSPGIDETRATPEQVKAANDRINDHYAYEAECEAERRMGA